MRRCKWCGNVLVEREMFAHDYRVGEVVEARSLGMFWLGPNLSGDSTVCDVRMHRGGSDHHEPIPLVPDLTDSTAVADWLED